MIIEYRSDTQKVTGSTGEVDVQSLGTPVPNMRVIDKVIDPEAKVADILAGALPVPDVTFLQLVADVDAFGAAWPNVTLEQTQEFDALRYINEHPELLVPFTQSVTAPDGTYHVAGADVRLDGVPASRYGYVACAEPFTYAQWDRPDDNADNDAGGFGPHHRKVADD